MTAFTVQVRGTICSMQVSRFLQTMGQDSFQNKQQSQILAVIIDVHASISLDFGHASTTFTGSVRQQRSHQNRLHFCMQPQKESLTCKQTLIFSVCQVCYVMPRPHYCDVRSHTTSCTFYVWAVSFLFSVRSVTFTVLEPCHCCLFCVIQDPSQNPVFHRQQLDDADLDEHRMAVHFAPF